MLLAKTFPRRSLSNPEVYHFLYLKCILNKTRNDVWLPTDYEGPRDGLRPYLSVNEKLRRVATRKFWIALSDEEKQGNAAMSGIFFQNRSKAMQLPCFFRILRRFFKEPAKI